MRSELAVVALAPGAIVINRGECLVALALGEVAPSLQGSFAAASAAGFSGGAVAGVAVPNVGELLVDRVGRVGLLGRSSALAISLSR
jgi:hypothetical protein